MRSQALISPQARMIGGFALRQAIPAFSELARESGHDTTASVVEGAGKIGTAALMGSAAGPWGALAAGGMQALVLAVQAATDSLKEEKQIVSDFGDAIKTATEF